MTKTEKPNYQDILAKRASDIYEKASEQPSSYEGIEVIREALQATAQESWKNGISAGRRQAFKAKTQIE